MDEPIYCLDLILAGHTLKIHGARADLQPALDAFMEPQWDENAKVHIKGFCNTADRALLHIAVKLEKVEAMNLFLEM